MGAYGSAQLTDPATTPSRILFIHTGARSARPDNQEILLDILKDLSAKFHSKGACSQKDLVQDTCDIAATLEASGLVGAGSGDENHVCVSLCDIHTDTTQYAALFATAARTPSKALPSLMKDYNVSPILVGPEADRYCQGMMLATEQMPADATSNWSTDTIGLMAFDPATGLLVGLTSSSRPGTANRGRVPPSCIPRVGLEIQSGDRHLCGVCTGFTDSMLLGHASVGDMLRKLPLSTENRSGALLNPLPVINPHVDFFVLSLDSLLKENLPPKLFTSCALGGEVFIYSWGPTINTAILSIVP